MLATIISVWLVPKMKIWQVLGPGVSSQIFQPFPPNFIVWLMLGIE